jgi:hypothetical protein
MLWDVAGAPRTYMFSKADDLIFWNDVEAHARETSEKLGLESLVVRFKNSGHCCYARENEGVLLGCREEDVGGEGC